jgi:hypothetical protein
MCTYGSQLTSILRLSFVQNRVSLSSYHHILQLVDNLLPLRSFAASHICAMVMLGGLFRRKFIGRNLIDSPGLSIFSLFSGASGHILTFACLLFA